MLLYNLRIAAKSLRRNPILTALLIGGIALGISVSTTFVALRHMIGRDPLPGKSQRIHYVRMDNWDPARAYLPEEPKSLPSQITYRDMRELMKSNVPTRQTGTFKANFFITPDAKIGRPYLENVRLVFSDFFPMFDVPFRYGSGWDKAADAKPEPVAVIDHATNQKLFGGANSIGKLVRIDQRDFKVVGVLEPWRPSIRLYDLTQNATTPPEAIFIPFNFIVPMEIRSSGNNDGWKGTDAEGFENILNASENCFIQFWVELPTAAQQTAYREFVDNYVRLQKQRGRFQRPLNNRVDTLTGLMKEFNVVPRQVKAMSVVSLLFLVVCSLNLVGLLLGKFLGRVPEVSVRRALGASRLQVFWQHIVECELVGVAGGALGILLSLGMLKMISKLVPNGEIFRLDAEMVLIAVLMSLVAGLMAGLYPAWRVCSVPPAMQLKVQ